MQYPKLLRVQNIYKKFHSPGRGETKAMVKSSTAVMFSFFLGRECKAVTYIETTLCHKIYDRIIVLLINYHYLKRFFQLVNSL